MKNQSQGSSNSSLDLAAVQKVAILARLKITDDEAIAIAEQLSAVLENFKQLASVDTSGIEPLVTPTELSIRLREDEAVAEKDLESFIANAPARSGNLFKVPPVVGG
jgi:aspartyl-tRNA(Asn)/glutamyl-tRNA(Gln) amidotransferase subunit C